MAIVPNLNGVPVSPTTPLVDPHNASFNERFIAALEDANPDDLFAIQVAVGTTRVHIPSIVMKNGMVVTNDPDGTSDVTLGSSGVTAGNGYKLKPGQSMAYGVTNAQALYAICATGSTTLFITGA